MSSNPPPEKSSLALGRFLGPATGALFLLLWAASFYPYNDWLDAQGTPLGGDYVMFYLGGQIIADGEAEQLYNQQEHCERLRQLFPALGDRDLLPYRYPPYVAAAFASLSELPFAWSFALFAVASATLWIGALLLVRSMWPDYFATAEGQGLWWGAIGWPVALETLVGGQASMFALAIVTTAVLLLRSNRTIAAGVILGLAVYKPNVLALFVLGCILKYPRLLIGLIPSALLIVSLGILCVGWDATLDYLTLGQQLASQTWQTPTPFWKVHGLISWVESMPGAKAIVFGTGLLAVLAAWGLNVQTMADKKESADSNDLYLAFLLVANSLFNPYPPIYDLVLLLVPFVLMAVTGKRRAGLQRWLPVAAVALFFGPQLSQALSFQIHGQLFTAVLVVWCAGLFWLQIPVALPHIGCFSLGRKPFPDPNQCPN